MIAKILKSISNAKIRREISSKFRGVKIKYALPLKNAGSEKLKGNAGAK